MSMNKSIDPRVNITHQIRAGQVYADSRTDDEVQLVYLDNDHVLLKDTTDKKARLLQRRDFEKYVGSGRYEAVGEVETTGEAAYTAVDFTKISGVGKKTARALQATGYATAEDVLRADRDELLAVKGVGQSNLDNIFEFIEGMDNQEMLQSQ